MTHYTRRIIQSGSLLAGSVTFNAPGTFSAPPRLQVASLSGKGGPGNPGNPGNKGNAGNAGSGNPGNHGGGGGGGGGGGIAMKVKNQVLIVLQRKRWWIHFKPWRWRRWRRQ